MTQPSCRAAAILKAKPGQEQALVDFTQEGMPQIRQVEGLHRVEVNRSVTDPGCLLRYYWWDSPAHSDHYVAGPVYATIAPRSKALAQEHQLVLANLIDA